MAERIREIPKKVLEWWNKFTPKQKTIIICVAAGVILAFSILMYAITKPQYKTLLTCETPKEAAEVAAILEDGGLTYRTSTDGLRVDILVSHEGDANLLLGTNNIYTDTYDIKNVIDGGFSTTESDKQKLYKVYLEKTLASILEKNSAVKKAHVELSIPTDDGTMIAQEKESFAGITLEIESGMEITEDVAASLARCIATGQGNTSTDNITIIDTEGNLLFAGEDNFSVGGKASTQIELKTKAESLVKQEVRSVLTGTTLYDNVAVTSNLMIDFSTTELTNHDFTAPEGADQGLLSQEKIYDSETTGGTGGEPGTGSNDENGTTYVLPDYANSSSTVSEITRDYVPNESVTNQVIPPGTVTYAESSIAVAATKLHVYKEEDVQRQGLLDGTTWDEFKLNNVTPIPLEVSEDVYALVAKATGIPEANIQIIAQEKPVFIDKEGLNVGVWDVVQIILIVVILALLAFVVLRSMQGAKTEEPEEELSVESLLQSTPQVELEDIEFEEKSESRKLIEKFVEDNPEAVANLLRNWLQEDWG